MARLVTFGCSYTYGHGLNDCYNRRTGDAGENPSKFAWPSLLGFKLKRRTVNLSKCGSSNKEILYRIQNCSFKDTDLVVILWTYPTRDCIIYESGYVEQALPHYFNKRKLWYTQKLKQGEFDYYYQMWTWMNYAKLYLDNLNIPNYHFTIDLRYIVNPPAFNMVNIEDVDFLKIRSDYDRALDNAHPGKIAHKEAAKQFKETIDAYNK